MKPLSTYYDVEVINWLPPNPGRVVTIHQIAKLFEDALLRTASMTTATNGFRSTGIWPIDPQAFQDSEFMPSRTTDRSSPEDTEQVSNSTFLESAAGQKDATPDWKFSDSVNETSAFQNLFPRNAMPIPHVARTAVSTGSPCRNNLITETKKRAVSCRLNFGERKKKKGKATVPQKRNKNFYRLTATMPNVSFVATYFPKQQEGGLECED